MSETVFHPEVDGISDDQWLELLASTGGEGRHFFTENQLYLSYARDKVQVTRYIARRGVVGLGMIVLGLATWVYALKGDWGILLVLGIACTLSGVGMVGSGVVTRRDPAAREPIRVWLAKWVLQRPVEQLIAAPALAAAGAEFLPANVQQLIIVERDVLLDLLLRNGAHTALSALIVAESGYPSALASEARKLLEQRPELRVVALHDATPAGVGMVGRLQKNDTYPLASRSIVDAGLFPADVTWLAELAPAIPASHTNQVPVDSLSYEALLIGLRGVTQGGLSIYAAIEEARAPGGAASAPGNQASTSPA